MSAARVEVVPWVHDLVFEAHGEMVKFVKTLPRNSTVCIESTLADLEEGKKIHLDALREVIHECEKLGIKLVPIESPALRRLHSEKYLRSPYGLTPGIDEYTAAKEAESNARREGAFVRNIKAALSTSKQPTLIVLAGASHANGIVRGLAKEKIRARINLSPFRQREIFTKILRTGPSTFAKEASTGITGKANKARLERKRLMDALWRRDQYAERGIVCRKINERKHRENQRQNRKKAIRRR